MIRSSVVAVAAFLVASGVAPASAETPTMINQPVSFVVQNTNNSGVACGADKKTYTVSGHLAGPASALAATGPRSGTLYLHGLELGEWFWQIPVDGYNHADEMARLGHISVTIDRLGYGESGHPNGFKSCVGGHASVAHQIIQQLRSGSYDGELHPQFSRVAVAGHSLGGSIAQIEAYSYKDVDAVAILSYADTALSASALFSAASWGPTCGLGGKPSADGLPGYAYFTANQAAYRKNFLLNATPDVAAYGEPRRGINPCGDLMSAVPAVAASLLRASEIKVPVLLLMGNKDLVFDSSRLALQKPLYGGPTTVQVLAGATHGLTTDADAAQFRTALSSWLTGNGF